VGNAACYAEAEPTPLNLYRRHFRGGGKCAGGHTPGARSYEHDEHRRGWKNRYCPIYTDGTLGGKSRRANTKRAHAVCQRSRGIAGTVSERWRVAGFGC